jgi:hypothetical protein
MHYLSSDLYLILKNFGDLSLLPHVDSPQGHTKDVLDDWVLPLRESQGLKMENFHKDSGRGNSGGGMTNR